jgi:raffinose/stachyose/melibiose transport system substrate-binding protein
MVGAPRSTAASRPQAKTTVTWWFLTSPKAEETAIQNLIILPFEQAHPDIQIKLSYVDGGTIWDTERTALAAGGGPDLVEDYPFPMVQFAQAHLIIDLTPYAKKYGWTHKLFPWVIEAGRYHGGLYEVAHSSEAPLLYYNTVMFKKYGWKPPTATTTWAELETLCRAIAAKGIIPLSMGTVGWRPTVEWPVGSFFAHDAGPVMTYDALTGKIPWTDPAFVDAMAKYNELWQNGWIMDKKANGTTLDQALAIMATGRAAMKIDGTFDLNVLPAATKDWDWGWAPYPIMRSGVPQSFDLSIGRALSINAHSAQRAGRGGSLHQLAVQ